MNLRDVNGTVSEFSSDVIVHDPIMDGPALATSETLESLPKA